MSSSALMTIGMRAMFADYASMQTTGHNIANANTPGYSRQTVNLATSGGQFSGAGFFGKGVDVSSVQRASNKFLTMQAQAANSMASMDDARAGQLQQLQNVFPTGATGMGAAMGDFLNSFVDLATAVQYAGSVRGVVAISNSYGGGDSGESRAYDQPGIAITASTGDNGYGVASPASYPHVVAVGGTTLSRANNPRGWNESAWSGSGSGCSTLNPKPTWQLAGTRCPGKANTDVSAVADPRTGVAVYDSTPFDGWVGWMTFGGTSASAPIIASVYALSRNTAGYPASHTWAHSAVGLNDLESGNNGTCPTRVWCHSAPGWDGPTGLGSPIGISAF